MDKNIKIEYCDALINWNGSGYRIVISTSSKEYFKNIIDYLCDNIGECNLIENWAYQFKDIYKLSKNEVLKEIFMVFKYKEDAEKFCDAFSFDKTIDYSPSVGYVVQNIINPFLFEPYTWKIFCKIRDRISKQMRISSSFIHRSENGLSIKIPNRHSFEINFIPNPSTKQILT
jgi:hypothetical protein